MNDTPELTGENLPPLTGAADFDDTSARGAALLDKARGRPEFAGRASAIDAYVDRKANRLAAIRKAAGLTQAQIAEELGVSQPDVSKMESRETHMVDTLTRFVAATGGRLRMIVEYDDVVVEYAPPLDRSDS